MADFGNKLDTLSSLQSGLSVSAGATQTSTVMDLGVNTSIQAVAIPFRVSFTNTGTTDNGDYEVRVQHSDDNVAWADTGQGDRVFGWHGGSAGADLTNSDIMVFRPKARYIRFEIKNNNATDAVSVDIDTGEHLEQS